MRGSIVEAEAIMAVRPLPDKPSCKAHTANHVWVAKVFVYIYIYGDGDGGREGRRVKVRMRQRQSWQ